MIVKHKYIERFIVSNSVNLEAYYKHVYETYISKLEDYAKTNKYVFIPEYSLQRNIVDIKVYQILNVEAKYPKPFYVGDRVKSMEFGTGTITRVRASGFQRIDVEFDNGTTHSYTYHGYKYPAHMRKMMEVVPFIDDKLQKI
jgi:hypothetical protein